MQAQAGDDHRATRSVNSTGEPGVFWDRSGDRYRAVHILPNGTRRQFYTSSMAEAKQFVQSGEKPKRSKELSRHNRPSGSNRSDEHEDGNTSNDSAESEVDL